MDIDALKENRLKWIKRCCQAIRILGWFVIVSTILIYALARQTLFSPFEHPSAWVWYFMMAVCSFLFGIVAIGVSQLIAYLLLERAPGWILRHGKGVVWAYAATILLSDVAKYVHYTITIESGWKAFQMFPFTFAKVLLLVGLGMVLRTVMPMIEESRTLV